MNLKSVTVDQLLLDARQDTQDGARLAKHASKARETDDNHQK